MGEQGSLSQFKARFSVPYSPAYSKEVLLKLSWMKDQPCVLSSFVSNLLILILLEIKVAQMVKHLPTMRETRVRSLGREDPLEKETATHSSTRAWKIPWTEEPGGLQSMGSQRVRHD